MTTELERHEGAVYCLGIETTRRAFATHDELEKWLEKTVNDFADLAVQMPVPTRFCKCPVPMSPRAKALLDTVERASREVDAWPESKRRMVACGNEVDLTPRYYYTDAELADFVEKHPPFRSDLTAQIVDALRDSAVWKERIKKWTDELTEKTVKINHLSKQVDALKKSTESRRVLLDEAEQVLTRLGYLATVEVLRELRHEHEAT